MWNDRYDTKDFIFGKAPSQFLVAQQDYLKPGLTALAVADGEGRNSVFMAEKGLAVTAMEAAPNAIAKGRALAAERGVSVNFVEADIFEWDWEATGFDIVAAIFIQFMGPDERPGVFDGMKRAVKPGGLLMLHGYTPKQIEYGTGGPGKVENLYTEDLLANAVAGWEILRLESYEADLDEGPGHSGRSALIDLIARKPA